MAELEIEYRFSSRRKSIGLMVSAEGKLVVAAPRGTKAAEISRALERHRRWIESRAAERREAWARLRQGAFYFLGQPYPLALALSHQAPAQPAASRWLAFRGQLMSRALSHIRQRLAHYAPELGVRVRPVEVREFKRRWGECHPDGRLRFNWRLIMLPPEIIDYVVVHELAHLRAPGHNPRFWQVVAAILPDYRDRRQWLNRYGTPFLLWQPNSEGKVASGQ